MIPILYDKSETLFTSGGLGFLADCISCTVTEELNGVFECEFEYPITGPMYPYLKEGNIVYLTHDDSGVPQPFDIYSHSAAINGVVTFYGHHISYRLSNAVIKPYSAISAINAVSSLGFYLLQLTPNPFSFSCNIVNNTGFSIKEPGIIRTVLGGDEGSIIKKYGGELEFDKFSVKVLSRRGVDTDIEIRYGKNLSDINDTIDATESYNAIVPYWQKNDGTDQLLIDDGYVYHDDGSGTVKAIVMPMMSYFSEKPSKQDMEDKAEEILEASYAWIPSREIEVNFVALWQTEEYKDLAPLERVNLGDTVTVLYPAIGVNAIQERVVKTVYNVLLDRYNTITLNQLPETIGELLTQQSEAQSSTTAIEVASAISMAVKLVQGKSGGHIYTETDSDGHPVAYYFMDTADTSTAVNVIKLDETGFSYSTTGINGTFSALMTMSSGSVTITGDLTVTGTINN